MHTMYVPGARDSHTMTSRSASTPGELYSSHSGPALRTNAVPEKNTVSLEAVTLSKNAESCICIRQCTHVYTEERDVHVKTYTFIHRPTFASSRSPKKSCSTRASASKYMNQPMRYALTWTDRLASPL